MRENYITHPGMITVDGGITWYTPDELVAAVETDILVDALNSRENEWQLPFNNEVYNEIREYLINNGYPGFGMEHVIAEYVRRTGRTIVMRVRT